MNEIMNELIEEIQKDSRYLSFKDKSKLLLKKETNELLERYQETLNEINRLLDHVTQIIFKDISQILDTTGYKL